MGIVKNIRKHPKVTQMSNYRQLIVIPLTLNDETLITFGGVAVAKFPVGPVEQNENIDETGVDLAIKTFEDYTGLTLPSKRLTLVLAETVGAVRTYSYVLMLDEDELNDIVERYEHLRFGVRAVHINTLASMEFNSTHIHVFNRVVSELRKTKTKK